MLSFKIFKLSLLCLAFGISVSHAIASPTSTERKLLCEVQDPDSRLYAMELGDHSTEGRQTLVYRHSLLGNVALAKFTCTSKSDVLDCVSSLGRTRLSVFLEKPLVKAKTRFMYKASIVGYQAKITDNFVNGSVDAICEFQEAGLPGEVPQARVLNF